MNTDDPTVPPATTTATTGPVRDADLHALVDGQLGPERAAEVSQWLADRPEEAARVLSWQTQRLQLRALHAELLTAPVPPALSQALQPPRAWWPQAAAAALVLGVGVALGWWLHGQQTQPSWATAPVPAFVHEAAMAHVVFVPEKRHPVEVTAQQHDHLVQWLSKRLGAPLTVPSLSAHGFELLGGRLLPGEQGQSRAQFMYENSAGERVTLYVTALPPNAPPADTAFRFSSGRNTPGQPQSFYWIDGRWGYALSASLPRAALAALAEALHPQLSR